MPEPFASAQRLYFWHFAALNDFAMSYMEDSMFISATPPVPDPRPDRYRCRRAPRPRRGERVSLGGFEITRT